MGRTSRATHEQAIAADAGGGFPLLIAAASTAAALALFFSTTVPAIAEHRHLNRILEERALTREDLTSRLNADAMHRISMRIDAQAIAVELDRRGVCAREALSEDPDASAPDSQARRDHQR